MSVIDSVYLIKSNMKVICAGFWKTGTKSLARALRILGYKVYDYDDQLFELENLWTKFFDGTVTDEEIRKSLEDVDVLIDGPVIAFWEEIHRAIPEAKVILTTRDEESWWKSLQKSESKLPIYFKVFFLTFQIAPSGYKCRRIMTNFIRYIFGVENNVLMKLSDNPRMRKYKFRQHNSHVIRTMEEDPSNFLIYRIGDGWEPLCGFLNKEVPFEAPYPHMNKAGGHFDDGEPQNPKFKKAMIEAAVIFVLILCSVFYILYILLCKILFSV